MHAVEDRVARTQTGPVTPRADAKHGLLVPLVGDAETWLDFAPLNVRVMVGDTPEQATEIELSWVGLGDTTLGRRGEPTAGDDHAVKIGRASCRERGEM